MPDILNQIHNVYCPVCKKPTKRYLSSMQDAYFIQCSYCDLPFTSRLYLVKSKSSQGDKSRDLRKHSIRVKNVSCNYQDQIYFTTAYNTRLEMREGDYILISTAQGCDIVENLTIRTYISLGRSLSNFAIIVIKAIVWFFVSFVIAAMLLPLYKEQTDKYIIMAWIPLLILGLGRLYYKERVTVNLTCRVVRKKVKNLVKMAVNFYQRMRKQKPEQPFARNRKQE